MVLFNVTNMLFSIGAFFLEYQPFASRRHESYADMSPSPEEEAVQQISGRFILDNSAA